MLLKKLALALLTLSLATPTMAADLKIGIGEDPDILDPDQSRTFVGEVVFANMCDKLVGITPDLEIIPRLATSWEFSEDGLTLSMDLREGVTFQDGTPFDAEAVVANINRSMTLDESRRKSELTSIEKVVADGKYKVIFTLNTPDVTLIGRFAARSGAMMSPTAFEAAGLDFGAHPVCVGAYKFKERVQQDRIVLEKDPGYYNADAYHFDTVTYLPIPDSTVRLANLRSGDLDIVERIPAVDAKGVQDDPDLGYAEIPGLGYSGITVNVANGAGADTPLAKSPLVRQALSLAIDRAAINQVIFDGKFTPGNQPYPPSSPWYDADIPVPARDVEKAKSLLEESGYPSVDITLTVPNAPESMQIAQLIQSMVSEAGFNLTIKATEFATLLSAQTAGDYQADLVGWSGYVDPDANLNQFVTCNGGINDTKYCNPEIDKLLGAARGAVDPAERKKYYDQARAILDQDLPLIYLYHSTWIWGMSGNITGFVPYPDGLLRLEGVSRD